MRLYINEFPRTLIIAEGENCLILKHPSPTYVSGAQAQSIATHPGPKRDSSHNLGQDGTKVIVEFVNRKFLSLQEFKEITPSRSRSNKSLIGFLGLFNLRNHIYLGFICKASRVASPTPAQNIHVVEDVVFYCLNSDEFDGAFMKEDDFVNVRSSEEPHYISHMPASSVKKLLSLGTFYFSRDFDITSTMQDRSNSTAKNFSIASDTPYYRRFIWNDFMLSDFFNFRQRLNYQERDQFDRAGFMTYIIRGYAKSVNTYLNDGESALLTLISKQSCLKKGAIFGEHGCDEDGLVSNYVESEIILYTEPFCLSYVIVRGNVPIFWSMRGFDKKSILPNKHGLKVLFTRSFEASQHSFSRHFELLGKHFGDVHIVNCLSDDAESLKGQLNSKFLEHLRTYYALKSSLEEFDSFDQTLQESLDSGGASFKLTDSQIAISGAFVRKTGYSSQNPQEIYSKLHNEMVDFGALLLDTRKVIIGKQLGVFRVISFDSLSVANFISKVISQEVLELAFQDIGSPLTSDARLQHAKLWEENGAVLKHLSINELSSSIKLLSATGASSKKTIKQQLTRHYLNLSGQIKPGEIAMLKLLGRLQDQVSIQIVNPFHQYLTKEAAALSHEFESEREIRVFASTFNVNGSVSTDSRIEDWLFPPKYPEQHDYDLVFIGFEEIIELSAGLMMNVKLNNLSAWETEIERILNSRSLSLEKYVTLWRIQMGGIALLIFVKKSEIGLITDIETSLKKTGLAGMSSNKGGIAVSLKFSKTSLCFVCAHLAAGMTNTDERHQNYRAISKSIAFSRSRKLKDHDAIIWLGDFNFRIDLDGETVKSLIAQRAFLRLYEHDQLNNQMAKGETFPYFDEMEITFPPTYKFDKYSDNYDTSDKQRIPAWTDRILSSSKRKLLKQVVYDCDQQIKFSDHRPVYALFKASVTITNERLKSRTLLSLYQRYTETVGDINTLISGDVSRFIENDVNVIPPPSSENRKWWLAEGKGAKITIEDLITSKANSSQSHLVINPKLPANPFTITSESQLIENTGVSMR